MILRSHDRGIKATKFGSKVIHPLAQVTLAIRVGLDHFMEVVEIIKQWLG